MASERPQYEQASLPLDAHAAPTPHLLPTTERGAVFTRREVVEFLLDLVGYTPNRPLTQLRLLEPAMGQGDFLLPAIERLLAAWRADPVHRDDPTVLQDAIRGVELHAATFQVVAAQVVALLVAHGLPITDAQRLADGWLIAGDFLRTEFPTHFDVVVGNPPYVRQEAIPADLLAHYRARFTTLYDRADLYIPFLEYALQLLAPGGQLGCICADRWMKNRYGGPLRQLVATHYHLKLYVDMVDTPAFHTDVTAYPAITVIARAPGTTTRVAHCPNLNAATLARLAADLTADTLPTSSPVRCLTGIAAGVEPWLLEAADQLALVRRLEHTFPTLEAAGCRVGIGVATGADKAFIGPFTELDVEPDRKLPLVMTRDIASGTIVWRGLGVINPFADDGSLVPLTRYPRLQRYLAARRTVIAGRHIAHKLPASWYRTIDRISPALMGTPKLLIPDIKGAAHIVYDAGQFYPHHNLYYITSDGWDLHALQAVLRAGIAHLFVASYTTRMRGGYLRFQAQYLRRIRIPRWDTVPRDLQHALTAAGRHGDGAAGMRAVAQLYGLTDAEHATLAETGAATPHDA